MTEPRKIIQLVASDAGELFALCDDGAVMMFAAETYGGEKNWQVLSETCPQKPAPPKTFPGKSAGGKARWANTTPEQRKEAGRRMALARYAKKPSPQI
jgi:hypothetical protein